MRTTNSGTGKLGRRTALALAGGAVAVAVSVAVATSAVAGGDQPKTDTPAIPSAGPSTASAPPAPGPAAGNKDRKGEHMDDGMSKNDHMDGEDDGMEMGMSDG